MSVDGDRRGLTAVVGAVTAGQTIVQAFGRTRGYLHQVDEVTAVQREFLCGFFGYGGDQRARVGSQCRRRAFDRYGFACCPDRQVRVFTSAVACGEAERLNSERLESLRRHGQGVAARLQQRKCIFAIRAGSDDTRLMCIDVGQFDLGIGNDSSADVAHGADDVRRGVLCQHRRAGEYHRKTAEQAAAKNGTG